MRSSRRMRRWPIPSRPSDPKTPLPKFVVRSTNKRAGWFRVPFLHQAGGTPIATARSEAEGRIGVLSETRLCGCPWAGHGKYGPLELRALLRRLLAPVENFLCPGQEERTLRETEIQIGNSRLLANPG
jgi:hypothetical protein